MIEIRNLHKSFGDLQVLKGVDLTVSAGEVVCIIGPSGSGKSTVLRCINRLETPTSGTVVVDGLDAVKDAKRLRRRVGFVFTDPLAQLLMSTPVEDVALSLQGRIKDKRQRTLRALGLLEQRGVGHVAYQSIYDLSGGERQLVALTSVLAVEPRVIVADEPTTLLDLRNRQALRRTLASLEQQVVYSTHDLEFAADADRVVVIDEGRVLADGPPAEALGRYVGAMAR